MGKINFENDFEKKTVYYSLICLTIITFALIIAIVVIISKQK